MKADRKTERRTKVKLRQQLDDANRRIAELEAAARADKTMERDAVGSTSLLDSIIEQNPHAMWISDENGTLIRLNQACRDLLHLSDEDVVGKYNVLRDNIVMEQGHMPLVKRVFEKGQTVSFTIEYDSSRLGHLELERTVFRILDVTIAPVRDENGRVTNAVIMHKDVTEQRQAEGALRSSRQQIELIVDTLPALLAYIDAGQRYLYVNRLYADWHGLAREEIIGKHVNEVLHEATYQKALPAIETALDGQRTTYENDAAYDVQGRLRTVRATYVPHLDESGRAKAFLAMIEDITERRQTEDRIKHLNAVLRAIRNVNQIIVREEDRDRLLQGACDSLTETRGYHNAWIALTGEGGKPLAVVESKVGEGFAILVEHLKRGEALHCVRTAMGQKGVVTVEDPISECAGCPLSSEYGGRGGLAVQLEHAGKILGLLVVSVSSCYANDEQERSLLGELASDIALALHSLELEDERRQAEQEIRDLARFPSENPNPVLRVNGEGEILYANDAANPLLDAWHCRESRRLPEEWHKTITRPLASGLHEQVEIQCEGRTLLLGSAPVSEAGYVNVYGLDITQRRQAEEELRRYVERLRVLRAIDDAILAAWSAEAIAESALQHIQRLVPYQRGSVTAFDLEADEATVLALHTDGEAVMTVEAHTPIETPGFESLAQGKVHIVDDILVGAQPTPMEQKLRAAGVRAYINVPLIADGNLIGTLNLGAEQPGSIASEHVDIAREVADQLALAIRQVGLREQVQRHADELELRVAERTAELERRTTHLQVAAEVARDAATVHDLDDLLDSAANLVRDRFGFYHAGVFLIDEAGADDGGEYAVLRSATGDAGRQMLEHGHSLKVGEVGIVGHVCANGEPRIAHNVGADAVHFDNPLLPNTRSEMALPMRVGGRVIGALDVQSAEESAFHQDDVEILQVMADQLAVAIERTRLFQQIQTALEERLRTIISNAPVILFALDREGVVTLSEGRGLEALNLQPGEHVGMSVFEMYREFPDALDSARRVVAGEEINSIIDLEAAVLETWSSPARDQDGKVIGAIGVAVDVTERERMQQQMQQQERLAAVGQLAGGIAHDFSNFLTTIIFYAHLIMHHKDTSPDTASIARTIAGEANRAADLVQQVLDFSRRSAMETEPVDLSSFIVEVLDILQKTLPENIRVIIEMGEDNYVVEIDPTRIQQVIMNLALNSRDAMPDGGELRIELSRVTIGPTGTGPAGLSEPELSAGEWVCLSVEDTGTGMDEHARAHLFEPFFTTKGPKGNGLGLAQVYGTVMQHGGEIAVETEVGHGTKFQIYLPIYKRSYTQAERTQEASGVPEGRGETILLVEDEEQVRNAAQHVLQSLGYRVLTASNGREGLEVFREAGRVDLVLTDMVMPEMGGQAMIREMRETTPDIKTVVVTGYTMQEDIQALRESGFADIIHKPLDVQALAQVMRRTLDAGMKEE